MTPTTKPKREGPTKLDMPFDEAMKRVVRVKPPLEGWAEYERNLKRGRTGQRGKKAKTTAGRK